MCADLNFHQGPRDPVVAKTILYSRKVSPSTQQMLKTPRELFRGASPGAWVQTGDYAQGG